MWNLRVTGQVLLGPVIGADGRMYVVDELQLVAIERGACAPGGVAPMPTPHRLIDDDGSEGSPWVCVVGDGLVGTAGSGCWSTYGMRRVCGNLGRRGCLGVPVSKRGFLVPFCESQSVMLLTDFALVTPTAHVVVHQGSPSIHPHPRKFCPAKVPSFRTSIVGWGRG